MEAFQLVRRQGPGVVGVAAAGRHFGALRQAFDPQTQSSGGLVRLQQGAEVDRYFSLDDRRTNDVRRRKAGEGGSLGFLLPCGGGCSVRHESRNAVSLDMTFLLSQR